jgi:indole-3-glycerol phosphate synthase
LPLLRKDFVFDPYQIYESAATGADAVLLIAAASDAGQLRELRQLADELRLDALVEVHDHEDLEKAVLADADLIGINNRNLRTFEVDLNVSLRLAGLVPDETVLVSESGITTRDEINRLRQAGFNAFLIGEQFMKSPQPGEKLKALWSE